MEMKYFINVSMYNFKSETEMKRLSYDSVALMAKHGGPLYIAEK